MNYTELIQNVANRSGVTVDESAKIIQVFVDQIKEQLSQGEKVSISGFGSFVLSKRKATTIVNPKTGVKQDLPERVLPHFKAGGQLKKGIAP